MPLPKPCRRRCVMVSPSVEFFEGLKSLRGLLLRRELLFNPRVTLVPVRNPLEMPRLDWSWRLIRAVVPVVTVLLCGKVLCAQIRPPTSVGSRFGMLGPEVCSTAPPTAEAVPALAWDAAFWLLPGVVPPAKTEALEGPGVTVVDTPRANPPA